MSSPTVSFNGFNLVTSVPGLIITGSDPYRMPVREILNDPVANDDKSVTSAAYWRARKVNIRLEIGQNTRELFDAARDTLVGILQGFEKTLIFSYGAGTRQWTASMSNMSITEVQGGHGVFDIEFTCADPMAFDSDTISLFSSSKTGATSPEHFRVAGTAPWQKPVITITISAITGGTGKTITVGNAANGQQVQITRNYIAGDVIVINARTGKVYANGTEIDFVGAIPNFETCTNCQLDYTDDFTTRTYTIAGVYNKRQL